MTFTRVDVAAFVHDAVVGFVDTGEVVDGRNSVSTKT